MIKRKGLLSLWKNIMKKKFMKNQRQLFIQVRLFQIKEIIFKVKDYDRLEDDYCTVLDMVTGARLSKPNYTMDAVRDAFNEFLDEHDKEVYKPAETVEKILNRIEKDATWMVISVYKNGRGWQLFREGYKIDEEDLTERERDWLESWVFAAYNGGLFQKRKKK